MNCPNGHGVMTRGEGFWVCLKCGVKITDAAEATSSATHALPDAAHLPYPAALAIARLRQASAAGESAWDRVSLFKEAVEATVKSFCVYGLGAYLAYPGRSKKQDEKLLEFLVRPSTGDWVNLLRELCLALQNEAQPCRGIYDLFFRRDKKDKPAPGFQMLLDFVPFRNELHHAARRPAAEYEQELHARLPLFADLVAGSAFLQPYPLLKPATDQLAERWSGTQSGQTIAGRFAAEDVGHFGFVAEGGRFVNAEPFVMFLNCATCATDRLFFYDSSRSYGPEQKQKRMYMLEYDRGHRPHRSEPVAPLEQHFSEQLLEWVYNAFRRKMIAIERYLKDFGTLVEEHADIIGRQFLRDRIQAFLDRRKSGVFLLIGEPGIGKTAFMANLVEAELGRVHFFYRQTSGLRSPDDFTNCILHSLLNKYRLEEEAPTDEPRAQRAQLANLLPKIAGLLKPGEKELIIVDALDEAGEAFDKTTAVQMLPQHLPDNIYVILSSRPQNPDLHHLASRGEVERFELHADSVENKADAYAYVARKLRDYCDEALQRRIADKAEWNFLFLKLLCEAITRDDYAPQEIEQFLARSASLQAWYGNYWERLQRRFEAQPAQLVQINAVIGAIAAADSPVTRSQVCDALALPLTIFDWCLRFIGQYLDVIPVTAEGLRRRGPRELVLYRLYHFSFREFVLAQVHPDLRPFHDQWSHLLAHWRDLEGHEREHALRHLPRHLIEAGRWAEVETLLTDLYFIEAKCAAGMTYDLIADYTAALDALPDPDARKERRITQERAARMQKYIQDLIAYAKGEITTLEIIPSIEPWTDEQIQADIERIKTNPTRFDQLKAFAQFVNVESHVLMKFAVHPGFVIQQAYNSANTGPIVEAAESLINQKKDTVLLLQPSWQRPEYNPHPFLLKIIDFTDIGKNVIPEHRLPVFDITPDIRITVWGDDKKLWVWDIETGRCLYSLPGHTGTIQCVKITPDGALAVSGGVDKTLRVWSLQSGKCLKILQGHTDSIQSLAVTPDGRITISGSADATLKVWNLESGECIKTCKHTTGISRVLVTSSGNRALSYDYNADVQIWDLADGKCLNSFKVDHSITVEITPDGKKAVFNDMEMEENSRLNFGILRIFDTENGRCLKSFGKRPSLTGYSSFYDKFDTTFICTNITPDGKRVLSVGQGGILRIWDVAQENCLKTLQNRQIWTTFSYITPDGTRAISGNTNSMRIWDLERGENIEPVDNEKIWQNLGKNVSISLDGTRVIYGKLNGIVRIGNVKSGNSVELPDKIKDIKVLFTGKQAVALGSKTLQIWDLENGTCLKLLKKFTTFYDSIYGISPDGTKLLVTSLRVLEVLKQFYSNYGITLNGIKLLVASLRLLNDLEELKRFHRKCTIHDMITTSLRIVDMENGVFLKTLTGHITKINQAVFSLDGRCLVSASEDGILRMWDIELGECLKIFVEHTKGIDNVKITPDGKQAISVSRDKTVRVWNLEKGSCLRILKLFEWNPHEFHPNRIEITPDGRRIVSISGITLQVSDLSSGECLNVLKGHTRDVNDMRITSDGKRVISTSLDHTIRIWDIESGEQIAASAEDVPLSISEITTNGSFLGNSPEILFVKTSHNLVIAPPVVTLTRLWFYGNICNWLFRIFGKKHYKGQWDNNITTVCQWCGQRFPVAAHTLDVIRGITRAANLRDDQSPCLNLPDDAWDEPRLLSACPLCRQPLKFNPFLVDNRERYG